MRRMLITLCRISPIVLALVFLGAKPGSALAGVPVDSTAFSLPIVVTQNGLWSYAVNIGVQPSATKGIDPLLGEVEYPPLPPGGGFTLLQTNGANCILDLRPYTTSAQIDTYRVAIVLDESDTSFFPMVISWPNLNSFYGGSVHLRSDISGSAFDIDMKAQISYSLAAYPFTPPLQTLYAYLIPGGPLQGPKLPVVSTYAQETGRPQTTVQPPPGA